MTWDSLGGLAALAGATLLGTATQRLTGVGFALVAAPLLVLILGPFNGVLIVNVLGSLAALLVLVQVLRLVEYRRVFRLMVPAVLAIIPGAWVASVARPEVLSIVIGVLIIAALIVSLTAKKAQWLQGTWGTVLAGSLSGFMNVTSGAGGPAITAYAVASRWPQHAFAASAQLYFFGVGTVSLLAKHTVPQLSAFQWIACGTGLVAGIALGGLFAGKLSPRVGRVAVISLAFAGALALLVKGTIQLVGG